MTSTYQAFLAHYGVVGMKWGKRKGQTHTVTSGSDGKFVKPNSSSGPKKTNISKMSNGEIEARIKRLNLEKQLKEASSSQSTTKGRKIIGSVLENSGKQAATTILTAAAIYGAKTAIDAKFGAGTSSLMFPKKK